jgi:hypothetical protein
VSLTPSKRFCGWANAKFTPAGGALTPIPGLTSCSYTKNPKTLMIDGDLDMYDTAGAIVGFKPQFKIATNKPGILDTISGPGEFSIERWDVENGGAAGGGGVSYTVANAIFVPDDQSNAQRAEGTGSATIMFISPDGVTNPVAVAAL